MGNLVANLAARVSSIESPRAGGEPVPWIKRLAEKDKSDSHGGHACPERSTKEWIRIEREESRSFAARPSWAERLYPPPARASNIASSASQRTPPTAPLAAAPGRQSMRRNKKSRAVAACTAAR